jgi:hypothetical protein
VWLLSAVITLVSQAWAQQPTVRVDHRFELVSTLFRLTENPDYNMGKPSAYDSAFRAHFDSHREHAAVVMARTLSRAHGLYFDRPAQLAPLLADSSRIALRASADDPALQLSDLWPRDKIASLVALADTFAMQTRFASFFRAQRHAHAAAEDALRTIVQREVDVGWYLRFFGSAEEADFVVVPGMIIGGANYGVSFTPSRGRPEYWAVIGVGSVDSAGRPHFGAQTGPTVIHEFGHSFVGPIANRWMPRMAAAAQTLTAASRETLQRWGYGEPGTTIHESLVRAATVVYVRQRGDSVAAREQLLEDERRGFLWQSSLVSLLDRYAAARSTYASFESFMPDVVTFFEGTRDSVDKVVAAYDARRPRVLSVTPSGGEPLQAGDVTVTITFDRPMRDNRRFGPDPERPQHAVPRVIDSSWNDDGRQLTVRLRLEAGREYALRLVEAISEEGVIASPTRLSVRTAPLPH